MIPRGWMGSLLLWGLGLAQTYTVAPGDTLYSIARRYGTTVEELMRLNRLQTSRLEVGQVLVLPKSSAETPPSTHIVAPGETLYSIARRYGTTVEELMRLNGLETFLLKVGQVLLLPARPLRDSQNAKAQSDPSQSPSDAAGALSDGGKPVDLRSDGPGPRSREQAGQEGAADLDPGSPLLKAVLKYLGLPYKYGANSPLALDCSAFVAQVYAELGHPLPRTTKEQYAALLPVETPLPGDLVFFSFSGREVDHVGVYLGRGVFAHASSYGSRVVIESLEAPFYQKTYRGARRLASLVKAQETPFR